MIGKLVRITTLIVEDNLNILPGTVATVIDKVQCPTLHIDMFVVEFDKTIVGLYRDEIEVLNDRLQYLLKENWYV